jgi:hypothetical protein
MEHECRVCHQVKSEDSFFRASKKDYVDRICKSCKHKLQQARQHDFKQWCIDYKGGRCVVCGYNKYIGALDFHHRDPSQKEFNFGEKKNLMTKEKALKELDKCILLCRNCHAELHGGLINLDEVCDGKLP